MGSEKPKKKSRAARHDELSTIRKVEKLLLEIDPPSALPRVKAYLEARLRDPAAFVTKQQRGPVPPDDERQIDWVTTGEKAAE